MFKLIISLFVCYLVYRMIRIIRASREADDAHHKKQDDSSGVVIDGEIVDDDK